MSRSISRRFGKGRAHGTLRRSALSIAVGVAAIAMVGPTAAAGAGSQRPGAASSHVLSPCSSAQLVIWFDTTGNGAAGSTYYNLEFTNLSAHVCSLAGYPGVSAITLGGAQLGLAAARTNLGTAVVRLAPGASATAVVQFTDTGNFPSADCHQVLAAGLRVYAPGSTISKTVAYPFDACSLNRATFLHVRPMEKGVLPQ